MKKVTYIIYATRKVGRIVVSEVGIATYTTKLGYWWSDSRHQIDSTGKAGSLQKTIDRLTNQDAPPWDITGEACSQIKPKAYTGTPYLVRIVEEET